MGAPVKDDVLHALLHVLLSSNVGLLEDRQSGLYQVQFTGGQRALRSREIVSFVVMKSKLEK